MDQRPCILPKTYNDLINYAKTNRLCISPRCTTCGARPFRSHCRNIVGFENICNMVRAVTPEDFEAHYTLEWMHVVTILDSEFRNVGGLPRDNYLLQTLEDLSARHEAKIQASKKRIVSEFA